MTGRNQSRENRKKNELFRKKMIWVCTVLITLIILLPMVFGDMGFIPYVKMQRTQQQLETELERLRTENRDLEEKIQHLRSDTDTIERIARERLGLVRPGEVVFTFPAKGEASGTSESRP